MRKKYQFRKGARKLFDNFFLLMRKLLKFAEFLVVSIQIFRSISMIIYANKWNDQQGQNYILQIMGFAKYCHVDFTAFVSLD